MTKYTYLIQIDSSLTVVVSEKEKPDAPKFPEKATILEFDLIGLKYVEDCNIWLTSASKYPIASKQDETNFINLVLDEYANKDARGGILIPAENVEIKKSTCKPRCRDCDERECTDYAYFIIPSPSKEDEVKETQEINNERLSVYDALNNFCHEKGTVNLSRKDFLNFANYYSGK